MSESLGLDSVVDTGCQLDIILGQLEETLTDFVTQINKLLALSPLMKNDKVNKIIRESIQDVETTIEPILKVFLYYVTISKLKNAMF